MTCAFIAGLAGAGFLTVARPSTALLARLAPVALLGVLNTVSGMKGLQHTNLPMYLLLRRMVVPKLVLVEIFLTGKGEPALNVAALAVLTAGTIISASGDLSFSPWGYAYTTLANCFTICYTLRMRAISSSGQAQAGDDGDKGKTRGHLGVLDLTLYIALLSLPLLVVCSIVTGEVTDLWKSDAKPGMLGGLCLCGAASLALLYQISVVVCTTRNSALATSVTGNCKDLFATGLGWLVFGGAPQSITEIVGLSVSVTGIGAYLYLKTRQLAPFVTRQVAPATSSPTCTSGLAGLHFSTHSKSE